MNEMLARKNGVAYYLDNILITVPNLVLETQRWREKMRRLQAAGIRTQKLKYD